VERNQPTHGGKDKVNKAKKTNNKVWEEQVDSIMGKM
jgi:hypothetical protein